MNATNKPRLSWIDYARGIAIILVVYRHVFEGLKSTYSLKAAGVNMADYLYLEQANIFFFSFRMPLFFLASGIFIGSSLVKRGFRALAENKARTILYPYFVWGIIQISIQILFSAFINSKKTFWDYTFLLYVPREVEQFWYLYALFNVTVIYAFLKAKTKLTVLHQIAIGFVLFIISAVFSQHKVEWGFVSDIFHYYIFLAIGDGISQSMLSGQLSRVLSSWKAFALLLIPFMLSQYYFLTTNLKHKTISPKFLYVEYYQPLNYLFVALTGCFFIVAVSSLLERYNSAKWLRLLGKHSLYIYVMHVIAFAAVRVIAMRFFHIYNVHVLMVLCVSGGVIIPVLIYRITNALGWDYLFSLEEKKVVFESKPLCVKKTAPVYEG